MLTCLASVGSFAGSRKPKGCLCAAQARFEAVAELIFAVFQAKLEAGHLDGRGIHICFNFYREPPQFSHCLGRRGRAGLTWAELAHGLRGGQLRQLCGWMLFYWQ